MRYPWGVALPVVVAVACAGPGPSATVEPIETPTRPAAVTPAPAGSPEPTLAAEPAEPRVSATFADQSPALTLPGVSTVTPAGTSSHQATPQGPQLRLVLIRARSSAEVQQLRQMRLDIVRVRPDPDWPPSDESLSGGFIVEAVVTPGLLAKLKALGFQVTEPPTQP